MTPLHFVFIFLSILGCDAFGPEPIWPPDFWSPTSCPPWQTITIKSIPLDKWSPTNSVPMDKWFPKIWLPWTNCPQPIQSLYFLIPTACPPGQTENSGDHMSRGTKLVGDHFYMGTKYLGTICLWWPNWLGTVCPEGTINLGPIVGDHMRLEPNVSQPNFAHYFLNLHERSWQTFLAKPETEMSKMRTQKTRGWLCSEGSQVFAIVKRYRLPIFCQNDRITLLLFQFRTVFKNWAQKLVKNV